MHRMRMRGRPVLLVSLALALGPAAVSTGLAQNATATRSADAPSPPSRELPRPDQLEPGVDTTATAPGTTAGAAAQPPAAASPTTTAPSGTTKGSATARAVPADAASTGAAAARKSAAGAKATGRKGAERIELDTTDITGNRELPKVLYIVPWKRSDLGDVVGRPVNSLLDEVLQPLDRDVFQRENRYYDAMKPAQGAGEAGAAPGSGDKP